MSTHELTLKLEKSALEEGELEVDRRRKRENEREREGAADTHLHLFKTALPKRNKNS